MPVALVRLVKVPFPKTSVFARNPEYGPVPPVISTVPVSSNGGGAMLRTQARFSTPEISPPLDSEVNTTVPGWKSPWKKGVSVIVALKSLAPCRVFDPVPVMTSVADEQLIPLHVWVAEA